MLDDRRATVLRVLVEDYIASGEPVSSRAILERSGLEVSSATIRNDLAALESDGYAVQPHTSAGRIPTSLAYRYYVDHLSPGQLRARTAGRINEFFRSVHVELSRFLKATTDLVSDLTRYPAIVLGPGLAGEVVRGVHLVALGPQVVLVVLVADSGRVSQELVHFDELVDPALLPAVEAAVAKLLAEGGKTDISVAARSVAESLGRDSAAIFEQVVQLATRSEDDSREIYVGGTSKLAKTWADLETVNRVLSVLEREAMLLSLLSEVSGGTIIQIGDELPVREASDLAMVSTGYDVGGHPGGSVAVLGPMRMDYKRAISILEEVSEGLADRLGS